MSRDDRNLTFDTVRPHFDLKIYFDLDLILTGINCTYFDLYTKFDLVLTYSSLTSILPAK